MTLQKNEELNKHPEEVVKAKPIEKEKTLLIWDGPERPFKQRDRKFYTSMVSVGLVLLLFLLFAGQFILIIVLLAVLFASYALYSVPPKNISYVLTDVGVSVADTKYLWSDFLSHSVGKTLDQNLISLELSKNTLLKMVYLIPDNVKTLDEAQKIVSKYLPEKSQRIDKNLISKTVSRLTSYIKEEN